ncbi:MAG: hypothetical protein KDC98_19120 [Planctomycetes bacterium]|nr:hypothetical protein [Planctomycetota bacterium]
MLVKLGPTLPGVVQGAPFLAGCELYLGAGPLFDLGLTGAAAQPYSILIPGGPAFLGLPLGLQGVSLQASPFQVTASNALDAFIADA